MHFGFESMAVHLTHTITISRVISSKIYTTVEHILISLLFMFVFCNSACTLACMSL
uniref:Uncharacterized protein n=1 Tax=Rhizophora mucronata TaxID=61149 RepID=A0A2P2QRS3_RHIMU